MRILIVEDHPDTHRWLKYHLEDLGYTVVSAGDLEQARSVLRTEKIDVLISDIILPDGDGWELLEESDGPRNLYAIAMSGIGRSADVARSRAAGFRHHLFKPFPMILLEKLLQEEVVV